MEMEVHSIDLRIGFPEITEGEVEVLLIALQKALKTVPRIQSVSVLGTSELVDPAAWESVTTPDL